MSWLGVLLFILYWEIKSIVGVELVERFRAFVKRFGNFEVRVTEGNLV